MNPIQTFYEPRCVLRLNWKGEVYMSTSAFSAVVLHLGTWYRLDLLVKAFRAHSTTTLPLTRDFPTFQCHTLS